MAAWWRGEDGDLNACNTPKELILSRSDVEAVDLNAQSCVDHSILAIFEDSPVASESKHGEEEESERLLSALTEMLDSVEDDNRMLSPFDTLPDSELLKHTEQKNTPLEESPAHRLRPRPKPPNEKFKTKTAREKGRLHKHGLPQMFNRQSNMLFCSKNKKVNAEVEVFTSDSLVSLVKLMHPYCLKLHVEEGDMLSENGSLFSQEEVWRYEQPTEEGDEEINVVSDDEAPLKQTKDEQGGDGANENARLPKSVLLNGNSSRPVPCKERKRVSFGSVHVALFEESVDEGSDEKSPTSREVNEADSSPTESAATLRNPAGSAPELSTPSSEGNDNKSIVHPEKGERKAKSLSLQQYRQLRQERRPLAEKEGNYNTKWPSVPEPPKELAPILCFQGQQHIIVKPKTTLVDADLRKPDCKTSTHQASPLQTAGPPEAGPLTHLLCSRGKDPRAESQFFSPASPFPDLTDNPNGTSVKKPALRSSDPPNPVLVPLPVPQTPSPVPASSSSESDTDSAGTQSVRRTQSSAVTPQRRGIWPEPKPHMLSLNGECNQDDKVLQEIKAKVTVMPPDVSSLCPAKSRSDPESKRPQAPKVLKEELADIPNKSASEDLIPPQSSRGEQSAAAPSGIEASDLASLLEQFEETQAVEGGVCETEPKPVQAPSASHLQENGHVDLDVPEPAGPQKTSRLLTSSLGPTEPLNGSESGVDLQMVEAVDIPEPLCTEIILSTLQETPARRKALPSKAIQIIDPRPLPPRKTHTSLPESPAAQTSTHMFPHLSSDHDYCGSVNNTPDICGYSQHCRATPSLPKEMTRIPSEVQAITQESTRPVSDGETATVLQHHAEKPGTRSKPDLSTDRALQFTDSAATKDDIANKHKSAPCSLPTPPPSPPVRGRTKRRYRRSPHSDSSSSSISSSSSRSRSRSSSSSSSSLSSRSASCSPKRPRLHHRRSESSSCSPSPYRVSRSPAREYRLSYSRSRSRSWSHSRSPSQSRSRSPSPSARIRHRRWRDVCSRDSRRLRREHEIRIQKLKAIDERRVVYVGRICRTMTPNELRERFTQFGEVECVSLHFRDRGDHYGFVTFYTMEDAFAAIDNGGKLRKPDELPLDICFGGRRQFCNSDYADLDASRDAESSPARSRFEDVDFDSLLKQAQRGLKR
ncbi:peroxisome proliferator-activated receptor gamma coactivator-related protein 1 isoform X2 [Cololabis saira]|uniref:peroxisome proliferator-activated receptor gamma coactivator-related protein 1 isoform X2 n=1 Tax=Cololabis saira TaxID=129043 RepID=UPI002AD32E00|nr:peroxisome proliferator-activated receptor gamma coactivator-related protein 1 isoform X2 [Cololabis saira]